MKIMQEFVCIHIFISNFGFRASRWNKLRWRLNQQLIIKKNYVYYTKTNLLARKFVRLNTHSIMYHKFSCDAFKNNDIFIVLNNGSLYTVVYTFLVETHEEIWNPFIKITE